MSRLCVISISVSILTAVTVCVAIILESMLNKYNIEFQDLREFKRKTQEYEETMKSTLEEMNNTLQSLRLQLNICREDIKELQLTSAAIREESTEQNNNTQYLLDEMRIAYDRELRLIKIAREKEENEKRVTKCPSYYSIFRSSCYMIYPYRMTWPEAYTFCQAVGAHLVYIEDREEHDFIKGLAAKTGHIAPQLWTGILEYMGGHIIFAGRGQKAPYLRFKPGEPSTSPTDDCVALNKVVGYAMEDYNCALNSNRFSLICEIDLFQEK